MRVNIFVQSEGNFALGILPLDGKEVRMATCFLNPVAVSEQVQVLARLHVDFAGVDCLPLDIRELLADPAMFLDPRVLAYTTGHSVIARILHTNPASDAMLRIVYPDTNGHPLTEGLDRFLSRGLSGQALRDRLVFCSKWLADHFVRDGARVVDLGGGSGSYAFESLKIKGQVPAGFRWDILDLDLEALAVARIRAERDLASVVSVRQGNFMKDMSAPADYAVMIGVLCGMDKATAATVLARTKAHLKPGGEIFAATLLQKAFDEDPRTFRILCNVGGWQLRPKALEQVVEVFTTAGWEIISIFSERSPHTAGCGQYAIVHARA